MNKQPASLRVLMVDDDEDDYVLTRAMFAQMPEFDAQVDWEATFDGGLARAERERYDVCLIDYRMGPESGIDWLTAARARGSTAPVILLTGHGGRAVDERALQAGAAEYLVKGEIDAADLARAVRYALDRARYLATIESKEQRYRQLFDHVPTPMWAFDRETLRFVAVNDAALTQYGYTRDEFLAMSVRDIRPPEQRAAFDEHIARPRRGYCTAELWEHVRKDGTRIKVDVSAHDVEIDGCACRIALARDITAEVATEERANLLARALESSRSGMMILAADGAGFAVCYVNSALLRMAGFGLDEVLGRDGTFLLDETIDAAGAQQLRDALERRADFDAALRCRRRDGTLFWAQFTLAPVRFGNAPTHFVAGVTDLTEQRRQEAEVSYLARHDAVTGLARFDGAEGSIQPLIDALGPNDRLAVFHVDLDRFQAVNDSLGYRGGNEMLHLIGQRLRYIAGDHGRLWRAGGDEFVLARRCDGPEDDPMRVAESIREWVEVPVELPGGTVHLSASVGIAVHPQHATVAVDLVQCADAALRRAKRSGRNSALSFAEGYMDEVRDRIALHGRLRHAIARNELLFHFQPQVRASDGYIVGMEALLRWATPDLGVLAPARFVPLAEDLGMIVEIGQWALRAACRQAAEWRALGLHDVRVSVNISALQLHRLSFLDDVCEALDAADLPASLLELELTETAIMQNVQRANEILRGLRDLGVSVSLDDFGIGHSCLSQLGNFPVGKLKLDRSFVDNIAGDAGGGAIARAIIALAHQLRLKVLAEGVETDSQFGYLMQNHCDEFQGYLFGHPLPAQEATALLRRRYVDLARFGRDAAQRAILLVDDEPNVLRSLQRALRRDGYTTYTATNALEGLDVLARERIQVVVSDQRMPGTSGTEFLSKVKEMYPDTVRMILSGYTDLATVTEAINRGAIYKFLTKPWDADDLREQVLEAFRRYDTQQDRSTA